MCKSACRISVRYLFILLSAVAIVVLTQKAESNINSLSAPDIGHVSRNTPDVKTARENTHSVKSNAGTASYCTYSTSNLTNNNHSAETKHCKKRKKVHPAYTIKAINVFTGKKNRNQFHTKSTDCRCCEKVADVPFHNQSTKANLPASLPVIPHYKPKQTLRWHMIV
ncbi:MAG: hypothetical protein CV082_02865 [Candidatus Brocadia sp. BL1]|nr:MAG: hypothetical protein CV082_02865 [Candidatus Brocadia sp. BL1]